MPSLDTPFFFHSSHRAAFLASMANRLSDLISEEGSKMLKQKGLSTPSTDVSFMLFLSEHNGASIADIANAQGFSHQRVASRISHLEKRELVIRKASETDQRCKAVFLTDKGTQEAIALADVYKNAAKAIEALFLETGDDLMEKLQTAIKALQQKPLTQRIETLNSHGKT